MILKLKQNPHIGECVVNIEYRENDEEALRLVELAQQLSCDGSCLNLRSDNGIQRIKPEEILYIEAVDRRTFCYTSARVLESELRLYEVEEKYSCFGFMRISKSCIVNLARIASLKPDFGGKILCLMDNGEKLYISRQYAPELKNRLGIGGKNK